jgi:hypothetical protein
MTDGGSDMDAPVEDSIRQQLSRYLVGGISVKELHQWLMPRFWTMDREAEPDALTLAREIGLYLAEYGAGHRTEPELRSLLDRLTTRVPEQSSP